MLDRLKYKLKESSSKSDINQDFFVQVPFIGEKRLLPVGEINHVVDVGALFNKERNESSLYRLQGTICPLFSNPLMNIITKPAVADPYSSNITKTDNGLDIFKLDYFTKDQTSSSGGLGSGSVFANALGLGDLNYEESYTQYLEENDGWFGFTDPDITKSGFCEFIDMEPSRARFNLNSNIVKNWDITITYPESSDTGHTSVYDSANSVNGLLIVTTEAVTVGGVPMTAFGTSVQHGLNNGDKVRLTGMTNLIHNGHFTVKRLGLDNGDYQSNYFAIDVPPPSVTGSISAGVTDRMTKIINGEPSSYYLRKFKKILVNNDYEIYPVGFSKTIFNDTNYQFIINEDIDVEGLKDNLGRPLSELYLTIVKLDSGIFGPVKSGLDLELIDGNKADVKLSNVRQIHDAPSPAPTPGVVNYTTSHIPLPGEKDLSNTFSIPSQSFYGDLVEYNRFTLKETILAEVLHRFNTIDRESGNENEFKDDSGKIISKVGGPRREGYLYKPHYLYKIREFSQYIEQGDEKTVGMPDYAEYLGVDDGRYLWRDFLDIGIFDVGGESLDYPFTNGCHYLHQNICFMTKRQDPFGSYGLYYPGETSGNNPFDPPDPRGDAITDKFIVKKGQDVC